ncbi:hypothetical protein KUL72_20690 [Bradyrhizobium arachidis]|uniref:hypothetical protein n=1 Tax=Bradyrhizobium arachidis TaxID=858423 RepID=UPI002161F0CD|nr:hypothetical protein [Bradyrhizobium arachidis]UVO33934.1 hypothetical protein KUL72_20690 [Bradyrhizobium arachidis]
MKQTLAQTMFDAGVRVEKMFWIGGVCAEPPHEFEEFVEDDLADCSEIMSQFPWLKAAMEFSSSAEDILPEFAIREIDGFFVQLATPTPHDFFENGYSASWGSYRLKWFFCSTLEEIADRATTWQKEVVERARAKAAA